MGTSSELSWYFNRYCQWLRAISVSCEDNGLFDIRKEMKILLPKNEPSKVLGEVRYNGFRRDPVPQEVQLNERPWLEEWDLPSFMDPTDGIQALATFLFVATSRSPQRCWRTQVKSFQS
jgi:hypothetical protein